jgi:hypothetical protein
MQVARISAQDELATTRAISIAGNSIQLTRPVQIAVRELHFSAPFARALSARLPVAYPLRGLLPAQRKRGPQLARFPSGLRSSTEDEINGTVKWVV